jgi:hypothetical protein
LADLEHLQPPIEVSCLELGQGTGPQWELAQAAQEGREVGWCFLDEPEALRPIEVQLAPLVGVLDGTELAAPCKVCRQQAIKIGEVQCRTKAGHVAIQRAVRTLLATATAAARRPIAKGLAPGLELCRREFGQLCRRQFRVAQDVVLQSRFGVLGSAFRLGGSQLANVPRTGVRHGRFGVLRRRGRDDRTKPRQPSRLRRTEDGRPILQTRPAD